jgi:hypothetical protein
VTLHIGFATVRTPQQESYNKQADNHLIMYLLQVATLTIPFRQLIDEDNDCCGGGHLQYIASVGKAEFSRSQEIWAIGINVGPENLDQL